MNDQVEHKPADIALDQEFASRYPMKILVAEDNILNQKLMEKMLMKLGYQPDFVENGDEALQAVKNSSYRLLLMDLQMPVVDGLKATELIIQQVEASQRPVIIAVTAAISQDTETMCLAVGMKGFIAKPITMVKLAKTLQDYY